MPCSSCFSISLPSCPPQILINAGLEPNTSYRWEITDKFDRVYNGITVTDATGLMALDIEGNPDIPLGLFMNFSGTFILKAYDDTETAAEFTIETSNYDCIELIFRDNIPASNYFNSDAPVYSLPVSTPIEVSFTDQTSVHVQHDLGYKPFVWVEDVPDHVIGCTVTHNSNMDFTVTFDVSTTGVIHYR